MPKAHYESMTTFFLIKSKEIVEYSIFWVRLLQFMICAQKIIFFNCFMFSIRNVRISSSLLVFSSKHVFFVFFFGFVLSKPFMLLKSIFVLSILVFCNIFQTFYGIPTNFKSRVWFCFAHAIFAIFLINNEIITKTMIH